MYDSITEGNIAKSKAAKTKKYIDNNWMRSPFVSKHRNLLVPVEPRKENSEFIVVNLKSDLLPIHPLIDSKQSMPDSLTQIKTLHGEIYVDSRIGKYYCFHPKKGFVVDDFISLFLSLNTA